MSKCVFERDNVLGIIEEELAYKYNSHEETVLLNGIKTAVESVPYFEAEPIEHGRWIEKNTNRDGTHNIYCNKCGKYLKSKGHANSWRVRHELLYCPRCGAKMV